MSLEPDTFQTCDAIDCDHAIDPRRAEMWHSLGANRLLCGECVEDLHAMAEAIGVRLGHRDQIKYRTVGPDPLRRRDRVAEAV